MSTSFAFRLSAAFVVLSLAAFTSEGRCVAQEARRPADVQASTRVYAATGRAALLLPHDPDEAFQVMKAALHEVRDDPDISEACRERLESRLEWALMCVGESGVFIKRLENERLVLQAEFRARREDLRFQIEELKLRLSSLLGPE
jgi:hypothetical protein